MSNTDNFLDQKEIDELVRMERAEERMLIIKELEKYEVYDDEPDNCRRIIGELKHFINNR